MTPTSTSAADTLLSADLAQALAGLQVAPEQRTITIDGETLAYENAAGLRRDLTEVLYRKWHSGAAHDPGPRDIRRDLPFEKLLLEATPHRFSKTAAVVRSALLDGPLGRHALYDVGRVRIQIPAQEGAAPLPEVGTRTTVDLPAVRPALSPGFFLVNGSAGSPAVDGHVLRIYVHIDEPAMAPTVWHAVLDRLERNRATYRAKVLAKAASFPRRDAIVVYLSHESWAHALGVVTAVADLPGLNSGRSVLTAALTDGVAYAWDPRDSRTGWDRMSFGQHRTAAVAGAVCEHVFEGADLYPAVAAALSAANTDPLAPHRNRDSPDWAPDVPERAGR